MPTAIQAGSIVLRRPHGAAPVPPTDVVKTMYFSHNCRQRELAIRRALAPGKVYFRETLKAEPAKDGKPARPERLHIIAPSHSPSNYKATGIFIFLDRKTGQLFPATSTKSFQEVDPLCAMANVDRSDEKVLGKLRNPITLCSSDGLLTRQGRAYCRKHRLPMTAQSLVALVKDKFPERQRVPIMAIVKERASDLLHMAKVVSDTIHLTALCQRIGLNTLVSSVLKR